MLSLVTSCSSSKTVPKVSPQTCQTTSQQAYETCAKKVPKSSHTRPKNRPESGQQLTPNPPHLLPPHTTKITQKQIRKPSQACQDFINKWLVHPFQLSFNALDQLLESGFKATLRNLESMSSGLFLLDQMLKCCRIICLCSWKLLLRPTLRLLRRVQSSLAWDVQGSEENRRGTY